MPQMQKSTRWRGAEPEQVGTWVVVVVMMMMMSPCFPPTPLLHPCFKRRLRWSTHPNGRRNCLGALAGKARGCSKGTGSPAIHQGGPLARCWVFLTCQQQPPLQPEQTADARRLLKSPPTRMQSKPAFKVTLFVQGREEPAGHVACGRARQLPTKAGGVCQRGRGRL